MASEPQDNPTPTPTPTFNATNSFSSESTPFSPDFIQEAGKTAGEIKNSAQSSAQAQLARLNDYMKHLYKVKELAKMAAKGAGARGAAGQQNPLAVYKGLTELARQASIPIDAEIAKTLQGSNNIENTMNQLLTQAGGLQAQLGSIMKSSGGGSGSSFTVGGNSGGRSGTARPGQPAQAANDPSGKKIDIRGNIIDPVTGQMIHANPGDPTAAVHAGPQGQEVLEWMERTGQPLSDQQKQILAKNRQGAVFSAGQTNIQSPEMAQWNTLLQQLPGASSFGLTQLGSTGQQPTGMPGVDSNQLQTEVPQFENSVFFQPGLNTPNLQADIPMYAGSVFDQTNPSSFFSNSSPQQDFSFSNFETPQFNPMQLAPSQPNLQTNFWDDFQAPSGSTFD